MRRELDDVAHYVYRYYNNAREVLYVGCTTDLIRRDREHRHDKPWYSEINQMEFEEFQNKWAGRIAERVAIQKYLPIHNQQFCYPPMGPLALALNDAMSRCPENAADLIAEFNRTMNEREEAARRERVLAAMASATADDAAALGGLIGLTPLSAKRQARLRRVS